MNEVATKTKYVFSGLVLSLVLSACSAKVSEIYGINNSEADVSEEPAAVISEPDNASAGSKTANFLKSTTDSLLSLEESEVESTETPPNSSDNTSKSGVLLAPKSEKNAESTNSTEKTESFSIPDKKKE